MLKIQPGLILNERYQILAELGVGGFGAVFHATDNSFNRDVAIKILTTVEGDDLIRFKRESKLLAKLVHPNIVKIFAIESIEEHTPFIVMQYLQGKTLRAFLQNNPNGLRYEECSHIFLQICAALSYAHKEGVIHRDLSSANVFLTDGPELTVKIIDFGLSKQQALDGQQGSASTLSMRLTKTNSLIGNPSYMSPEACRGEGSTPKSDIYSLGCLLYEMLSGTTPFPDSDSMAVLYKHLNEYPRPPVFDWNSTPEEKLFKDICLLCLQKETSKRPDSVESILEFLSGSQKTGGKLQGVSQWQFTGPPKFSSTRTLVVLLSMLLIALLASMLISKRSDSLSHTGIHQMTKVQQQDPEEKRLLEWLAVKQRHTHKNDPAMADALLAVGTYYSDLAKANQAIPYLSGALKITENKPEYFNTTINIYRLLAIVYQQLHKYSTAQELLKSELLLIEQHYGVYTEIYWKTAECMAANYAEEQKYNEAEKEYIRCLEIAKKLAAGDNLFLLHTEIELARFYGKHGKAKLYLLELEKAAKVARLLLKKSTTESGLAQSYFEHLADNSCSIFFDLAQAYFQLGELNKAKSVLLEAQVISKDTAGPAGWTTMIDDLLSKISKQNAKTRRAFSAN